MTIYYTAKDIEELAAQGIQELDVGSGVTLTDFARETARQLNIDLVEGRRQVSSPTSPVVQDAPSSTTRVSDKYNKPSGCQHGFPSAQSQGAVPAGRSTDSADSNTMNQLIDLMGQAVKRGE